MKIEMARLVKREDGGELRQTQAFKDLSWEAKVDLLKDWRYELDTLYQTLLMARNAKEK